MFKKLQLQLFFILLIFNSSFQWTVEFHPNSTEIDMNSVQSIQMKLSDFVPESNLIYEVMSDNSKIAFANFTINYNKSDLSLLDEWNGSFNVTGIYIGQTSIYLGCRYSENNYEISQNKLLVNVVRKEKTVDLIFNGIVAVFISIMFINFGAALDLSEVKNIFQKPTGPIIGFFSQFLFMPLISYTIGLLLFPQSPELQLGLFFIGVSPAGGISNMWACILDANLNLSIIMTTISTFAAFVMMPLWVFTLGKSIFLKANITIPFEKISIIAISFLIPLIIGVLIKKYLTNYANVLVKFLKIFSIILIVILIIFGSITNNYMWKLFSIKTLLSGFALPFFGFLFGYIFAKIFNQNDADALAICIETGIQNVGIALMLIRFSLPQPAADLTIVIPLAVSFMTQLLLIFFYFVIIITNKCLSKN